jgi:hypothetical protein
VGKRLGFRMKRGEKEEIVRQEYLDSINVLLIIGI